MPRTSSNSLFLRFLMLRRSMDYVIMLITVRMSYSGIVMLMD